MILGMRGKVQTIKIKKNYIQGKKIFKKISN